MLTTVERTCKLCSKLFYVEPWKLKWKKYDFCSKVCSNRFHKDTPAKKGHRAWNKDLHINLNPGGGFKKGHDPWNKGIIWEEMRGSKHPAWKGGRQLHQGNYWIVKKPEHPTADRYGYVREHRLIMEEKLGRFLDRAELVHHINHDKTDNRIENLMVVTPSEHTTLHRKTLKRKFVLSPEEKKLHRQETLRRYAEKKKAKLL